MRRVSALAILAIAAFGASSALAGTSDYAGTVNAGGTVQLRIKKAGGARKITRFDFQHVGIRCDGKRRAATGNLNFTRSVKHGHFTIRGQNEKDGVIRVNGDVRSGGRKVTGTIRLDGAIHVDGITGYAHKCHSGLEGWTARRG
jgi:hypothetical protein